DGEARDAREQLGVADIVPRAARLVPHRGRLVPVRGDRVEKQLGQGAGGGHGELRVDGGGVRIGRMYGYLMGISKGSLARLPLLATTRPVPTIFAIAARRTVSTAMVSGSFENSEIGAAMESFERLRTRMCSTTVSPTCMLSGGCTNSMATGTFPPLVRPSHAVRRSRAPAAQNAAQRNVRPPPSPRRPAAARPPGSGAPTRRAPPS